MSIDPVKEALIRQSCKDWDLYIDEIVFDPEENAIVAKLGRFKANFDNDQEGIYEDDEGELKALVVGAPQYRNQRVALYFTPDGLGLGSEIFDPLGELSFA